MGGWRVLECSQITPTAMALDKLDRKKVVVGMTKSAGDEGFKENELGVKCDMPLHEEALVVFLLFTSVVCFYFFPCSFLCFLFLRKWRLLAIWFVVVFILVFTPMPRTPWILQSRLIVLLYKYFSYRWVWEDGSIDIAEKSQPWIGFAPPHGAFPFGNLLATGVINFMDLSFIGAAATVVFYTPVLKLLCLFGVCDVSKQVIKDNLRLNQCVGLVPDGIAGIFTGSADKEVVAVKDRKGVAKLALQTGRPIMPVFVMGNSQVLRATYDPWGLLEGFSRKTRISFFFTTGRFIIPIPFRQPLTAINGRMVDVSRTPIEHPTQEQIDEVHSRILVSVKTVFEKHRAAFGWKHRDLVFT